MCRSATFAIVPSKTNIKAASIAGKETTKGFFFRTPFFSNRFVIRGTHYLILTLGTTDMPATILYSSGLISSSKTILTGIL